MGRQSWVFQIRYSPEAAANNQWSSGLNRHRSAETGPKFVTTSRDLASQTPSSPFDKAQAIQLPSAEMVTERGFRSVRGTGQGEAPERSTTQKALLANATNRSPSREEAI